MLYAIRSTLYAGTLELWNSETFFSLSKGLNKSMLIKNLHGIIFMHIFGHYLSGYIFSGHIMSNLKTTSSFGALIRELRKKQMLPLRKVAARLDIDPSTLGKMEKNTRRPTLEQVTQLASIFDYPAEELMIHYFSDLIVSRIENLPIAEQILKASENKIKQRKNNTL